MNAQRRYVQERTTNINHYHPSNAFWGPNPSPRTEMPIKRSCRLSLSGFEFPVRKNSRAFPPPSWNEKSTQLLYWRQTASSVSTSAAERGTVWSRTAPAVSGAPPASTIVGIFCVCVFAVLHSQSMHDVCSRAGIRTYFDTGEISTTFVPSTDRRQQHRGTEGGTWYGMVVVASVWCLVVVDLHYGTCTGTGTVGGFFTCIIYRERVGSTLL